MSEQQVHITCLCGLDVTGPLDGAQSVYREHGCKGHDPEPAVVQVREVDSAARTLAMIIVLASFVCVTFLCGWGAYLGFGGA